MTHSHDDQQQNPRLPLPVRSQTKQGNLRRIGVELEMSGLTLGRLAEVVADSLQLEIVVSSRYERTLQGDPAGDWLVELDFNLLKEMGRQSRQRDDMLDDMRQTAEEMLHRVAETVVPLELVSPPLPMDRLCDVETLITALRDAGARGSSDHLVNAFGMQFNPEIPDARPATLTAYMQAFLCLYDWLLRQADIDMTRRLTTYVDPFPPDYVRQVVDPAYAPDLETLMADYLQANPTRNRALDWLPLFAHLDSDLVGRFTRDPLIKPRPALHYRLPSCEIHRADWQLSKDWRQWLQVEQLAAEPDRLAACCAEYSAYLGRSGMQRWLSVWEQTSWLSTLEGKWLDPSLR